MQHPSHLTAVLSLIAVTALAAGCGSTVPTAGAGQAEGLAASGPTAGDGLGSGFGPSSGDGLGGTGEAGAGPTGLGSTGDTSGSGADGQVAAVSGGPADSGAQSSGADGWPASGATGASGADPAVVPGTTATTIKVGFPYLAQEDANTFTSAVGASGIAVGDTRAQFNALVEEVNSNGGILGRKVVPVFFKLDSAQTSESQQQSQCEHFTRDNRVFAVMMGLGRTLRACLNKAGVPNISGRLSVAGDSEFREAPLYVEPSAIGLDGIGRSYPQQLSEAGFLKKSTTETEVKLGVIYFQEPAFANAYKNHLKPGFAKVGVPVTADAAVPNDNLAALNSAVQSAVLRFNSEGINRVTFLDYDAFTVGFFMVSAEQQGYRPTYAINSQNAPANLAAQKDAVSENQLRGTYLIGWRPTYDVSSDDKLVPPGQKKCLDAVRSRNVAIPSRNGQGSVTSFCDSLFFLKAALERAGNVSASAFLAGTNALGSSYVPAATYRTTVGQDKHDGASSVRQGHYVDECACFRYMSGLLPL
jgi:hypothetical protein